MIVLKLLIADIYSEHLLKGGSVVDAYGCATSATLPCGLLSQ